MFSVVKTVFLPLIFTLFIFLYCDIFLLVKILVINEGANPDLRKHTRTHVLHMLQLHAILPTENQTNICAPVKFPFGPQNGIERCRAFLFQEKWNETTCSLIYCTTKSGTAKQLQTLSCGEAWAKAEEWGELNSEEKYHVCLLYCFCILNLTQISWPNIIHVQITSMAVIFMWALWAKSAGAINRCSSCATGS